MRLSILAGLVLFAMVLEIAPSAASEPVPAGAGTPSVNAVVDPGRKVFDGQHCSRCHALAGKGNKIRPLDDVGARLDAAQIRAAVTATAPVRPALPARALVAKQKFGKLPATELDALVTFLAAQKTKPAAR